MESPIRRLAAAQKVPRRRNATVPVMAASTGDSGGMLRAHGRPVPVVPSSVFKGFRFPSEIIVLAVRWYLRYGLSTRPT
jgi:hypothetical protein